MNRSLQRGGTSLGVLVEEGHGGLGSTLVLMERKTKHDFVYSSVRNGRLLLIISATITLLRRN